MPIPYTIYLGYLAWELHGKHVWYRTFHGYWAGRGTTSLVLHIGWIECLDIWTQYSSMVRYHEPILWFAINAVLHERSPVAFFAIFTFSWLTTLYQLQLMPWHSIISTIYSNYTWFKAQIFQIQSGTHPMKVLISDSLMTLWIPPICCQYVCNWTSVCLVRF